MAAPTTANKDSTLDASLPHCKIKKHRFRVTKALQALGGAAKLC
jgi:hypothetical protein